MLPGAADSPEVRDDKPIEVEPPVIGDPLLARVKEVAQRIINRVRHATADIDLNHRAPPPDPTDEAPHGRD